MIFLAPHTCPTELRALTESADLEINLIAAYGELIKDMQLDELQELRISPLKIPEGQRLVQYSGGLPLLKALILFATTRMAPNELVAKLKPIIDAEIESKTKTTRIHNIQIKKTENVLRTLDFQIDLDREPLSFFLSPDSKIFYANLKYKGVKFFDAITGKEILNASGKPLTAGIDPIDPEKFQGVALSVMKPDGSALYTTFDQSRIDVVNAITANPILDAYGNRIIFEGDFWEYPQLNIISALAISTNGNTLYAGYKHGNIRSWRITKDASHEYIENKNTGPLQHTETVTALTLSADGNILYSGHADGKVRFWDAHTLTSLKISFESHQKPISYIAHSTYKNFLYSYAKDHTLRIWKADTGDAVRSFFGGPSKVVKLEWPTRITTAKLSRTGKVLFLGSNEGDILFYNAYGRPIENPARNEIKISGDGTSIVHFAESADGRTLYSINSKGRVRSFILSDYLPENYLDDSP